MNLCHALVLVRVQASKMEWHYLASIVVSSSTLFDEFSSLEGFTHKSLCLTVSQGQRFTEIKEHSFFYIASCASIKGLLGRQLICQVSFYLPTQVKFLQGVHYQSVFFSQGNGSQNHSPACQCLLIRFVSAGAVHFG